MCAGGTLEMPHSKCNSFTRCQCSHHPVISILASQDVARDAKVPSTRYTMHVNRVGALAMLMVTVLWAVTPALACLVPMRPMTQAEHECCKKMAQQCGPSAMPSSHSCCQGHEREGSVTPVPTYSPTRPFEVAIVPPAFVLLIASETILPGSTALDTPRPEESPGCCSILRV